MRETGTGHARVYTFAVPLALTARARYRQHDVGLDTLVIAGNGVEMDFVTRGAADMVAIGIDQNLLWETFGDAHRFAGRATMSCTAGALRAFAGLLRRIFEHAERSPTRLAAHAVVARDQVLSGLDVLLTAQGDEAGMACPTDRYRIVDRARALMTDALPGTLTVASLCRQLGVSRRHLQNCFHAVLGVSPAQSLRACRLNGVRRALQAERAPAVHDIASDWGFWHLSHFARDYRLMFGELPSATRARRPGAHRIRTST